MTEQAVPARVGPRSDTAFVAPKALNKSQPFEVQFRVRCRGCEEWYDWTEEFQAGVYDPSETDSQARVNVDSDCPFCGAANEHEARTAVLLL